MRRRPSLPVVVVRSRPSVALALPARIALVACSTTGSTGSARPLENTEWRLVELNGRPAVGAETEGAAVLRFAADSARVTGSTGCNSLAGPFTRGGESLRFGALITTKRACVDPARNQQEQSFLGALGATERYTVTGDTLTLFSASGPLARLVARPG